MTNQEKKQALPTASKNLSTWNIMRAISGAWLIPSHSHKKLLVQPS
jgi:hypothetical protein